MYGDLISEHGNLWRAFLEVARVHPDVPAFGSPEATVDYGRLAVAAATVAHRLSAWNVGPGDLVAVEMPVGPEFVVAALGSLAAGAAYLPVDVTGPAKRREHILRQARPAAVLRTGDVHDAIVPPAGGPSVCVPGGDWPSPATGENDPAYVIYTSGSTGTPKGVIVPARGVLNLLDAFQRRGPLGPGARHSWWTSPGFDVSIYEMWSALCSGGTVVPVPERCRRDIDATLDHLAEQRVDSAYVPPQFLSALRDRLRRGAVAPTLRRLLTGVEPIPVGLLVELRSYLPEMVVINGYGPTETTVCATLYTVPDQCAEPERRTPIGTVIEGNRGFVLDDRLNPVEPGNSGELFIAGRGVAVGYLHDTQRTAERFLPAADGVGLMYRTGDLVVSGPDGQLTFLGRADDQLKIDGVRIEPAETEAALRRFPEVSDVAVLPWPTGPDAPSVLTAFIVPSSGAAERDGDLWSTFRVRLAEEIPAQAVPRRFFALERIPMTADGKLDRKALPQPREGLSRPARDASERVVEDACRAVLVHTPLSVLDLGFTELGGDSLQAAQLASALRTRTGRSVTAAHVLAAPTLAELARQAQGLPPVAESDGVRTDDAVLLTQGQAGIWAAEMTAVTPGAFHEALAVELAGDVDPRRIARELARVLDRHAIFRGHVDEDTMQFVSDGCPLSVAVREVASGETLDGAWQELVTQLQRPAFDLHRGPLVRAAVLAAPRAVRLLLVWHHIVVDAWSARIVLEELAAALDGAGTDLPVERGHADYAHRQRLFLESAEGKRALETAAGRVSAWFPAEVERPPAQAQERCQLAELSVGPEVWARARACARRGGTTMFAVTLAAVLDGLCRLALTGGRFALAVADRDEVADAGAAGYFLTTVPFGPSFDQGTGDPDPHAALRHARDAIAEAHAMSRVPFPSLMAELGLRDAGSIAPLVVAWNHDPSSALSAPGRAARSLEVSPLAARWPWTVLLTDRGDRGMSGRIEFPPSVPRDDVAWFCAQVESVLDAFVSAL
ncbi:amino acid adenylation domain-containing protein [Streptomyces sp. PTM05]|uniref:Amino acid adenylation domain-containing protein n=1 Tax=Streptantibioticus parmotrematis TaxID=2873249 RepID=A0ABS7QNI5_9ACTN|nr:non-ribosomal peptide synthetase [Streptantibioticus parmotrematis]MBY8884737.1 amino acid adenylation domain-containing protein [Streptantibioticus parmotrematis]